MLRIEMNTLYSHLFRARRQLLDAGIPGGVDVVEKRSRNGQLRIGTPRLSVEVR